MIRMRRALLRDFRAAHGLTQAELGRFVGVSRNTIERWERGVHPIPQWARLLLLLYLPAEADPHK